MVGQGDKVCRREGEVIQGWGGDGGTLVGFREAPGPGQANDPTWGGSPHLLPKAAMGTAHSWERPTCQAKPTPGM